MEIADLLGKIGVGAIIGAAITAFFTFFTSWLARRHEIRRERFGRKQGVVEAIAGDFEKTHATFMELFSAFGTYLELEQQQPGSAAESLDRARKITLEKVYPALNTLHSIEGRLMLIADVRSTERFQKYRSAVTDLQAKLAFGDDSRVTLQQWNDLFWRAHGLRPEIYADLRKIYNSA